MRVGHDKLIDILETHYKIKYPNDTYYKKLLYEFGRGRNGELDLVRITNELTFAVSPWHVYEIKCSDNPKSVSKAIEQLNRFRYGMGEGIPPDVKIHTYIARRKDSYLWVAELKVDKISELEQILIK